MSNQNDEVGYKKPPSKNRFQKGRSGNPNGRPKKDKNKLNNMIDFTELFLTESERRVVITENGEPREMMMIQVAIRQALANAAKGNISSLKFVVSLMADAMRRKELKERDDRKTQSKKTADSLIQMMTEDDIYRTCKTMYETVRKPDVKQEAENKGLKLKNHENMTPEEITENYMNRVRSD